MPVLSPNDSIFQDVPDRFFSPFPSNAAQASGKFAAIASDSTGYLSAAQATAWQDALRMGMREVATSSVAGGFRNQWLTEIAIPQEGWGGAQFWDGLFAKVSFQESTNKNSLLDDMQATGFDMAINFISARTGVYGQIFKAAIDIGKYFWKLARESEDIKLITVPWQEYSRDSDEDLINSFLLTLMRGVDWTPIFSPAMDPRSTFKLAETSHGGNTRAFGAWGGGDQPDYTSGWGFQPGTQQMADVIQLAYPGHKKYDIITNIGTFYPATCQYATAAENFINRVGSADMYKIQPAWLEKKWNDYYDGFFDDGFGQLKSWENKVTSEENLLDKRMLAKAIWQGIWRVDTKGPMKGVPIFPGLLPEAMGDNIYAFTNDYLFLDGGHNNLLINSNLSPVNKGAIAPALKALRKRQMSCLAHSLVCAYVRPRSLSNSKPAFAAFEDPGPADDPRFKSWGEELVARCDAMRELFLKHMDRYKVRTADVMMVDPKFGERLRSSKRKAPDFGFAPPPFEPLDPDAPTPPPSKGPSGGAPGGMASGITAEGLDETPNRPPVDEKGRFGTGTKVAAGLLVAAGGLGYAGHRMHRDKG
jgi:hypothetical protein